MSTHRSSVIAVMTLLFFGFLGVGSASAVEVVATSPGIDATVAVSPNFVSITVDQELLDFGNQLTVISPSNERVDDGLLTVSGATLSVGMTELLESGKYRVEYELLVAEDAPVFGNFSFTFEAPPVIVEDSPTPTPTTSDGEAEGGIGSNTTDYFVIGLLVLAFFILMWLARFARTTFRRE